MADLLSKRPSQTSITRVEWDLEFLGNERVHEELFGSRMNDDRVSEQTRCEHSSTLSGCFRILQLTMF